MIVVKLIPVLFQPHGGVFLKKSLAKGKEYYYLAESVRMGASVRTKVIRALGSLTPEGVEYWKGVLQYPTFALKIITDSYTFFYDKSSLRHGIVAFGDAVWKSLGIDRAVYDSLSRVSSRSMVAKLTEIMVLNRFDDPCSKLALLEWIPLTSLPYILDRRTCALNENSFYRAMDILWERRDSVEKRIYKSMVKPLSKSGVLAKDITSTYFEGGKAETARYGYSRDHRTDLKQVTFSLIETEDGYPITLEVYPGNTQDKSTVKESVRRLKTIFGITRGIFVFDRGMVTDTNIEFIREEGFSYIASESIGTNDARDAIDEALKNGLETWYEDDSTLHLQTALAGEVVEPDRREVLKGREIVRGGIRYIVVHSSTKERDDLEHLQRVLAKAESVLSEAQSHVAKRPKMSKEQVIEYVSRQLLKNKLFPYFKKGKLSFDESSRKITASYDKGRMEREKRYAGVWLLSTDIPGERKTPLEIVKMYKGLWVLENTFREMKSSLDLRPMWHRKPDRIKTHIWICMIAYLIERVVESRVRQTNKNNNDKLKEMTGSRIFESFRDVRLTEIGIRGQKGSPHWTVTQLNDLQMGILDCMKIDPELIARVPQQRIVRRD